MTPMGSRTAAQWMLRQARWEAKAPLGATARRCRDAGSLTLRKVLKIRAVGWNPHDDAIARNGSNVHTPSLALHKCTVLSDAAHTIYWPSGENSVVFMMLS